MEKVYEIYIRTTPEELWHALTDQELRAKYTFGVQVTSDWTRGSRYEGSAGGSPMLEGENIEVDPPQRFPERGQQLRGPVQHRRVRAGRHRGHH